MTVAEALNNLAIAIENETLAKLDLETDGRVTAVTDIYEDVLDRSPDEAGLDYWVKNPGSIADVYEGIKESPENREQDIRDAYSKYLGRAPGASGLSFWLNHSGTIDEIIDGIKNSKEAQIVQAYQKYLGRMPDAEGLAYWINQNASIEQIVAGIAEASGRSFAVGGYMSPGLSLVGEQGPELVNFARPSMVYTANETRDILKGGSDNEDVKTELKHIREENQANQQAIVSLQYRMYKIFQRWDGEGLPDERTVNA